MNTHCGNAEVHDPHPWGDLLNWCLGMSDADVAFAELDAAGKAPHEPTPEAREFARFLYDYFVALVDEGFTEGQALRLLGYTLADNGDVDD